MLALLVVVAFQAPADTARVKASVLSADSATSIHTFLARLEPDAAVLFPEQPILVGRAAIRGPFAARYLKPGVTVKHTPLHAVASSDGRLACVTGITAMTVAGDTARAPRPGRYLTCWRRGDDGTWRMAVHSRSGETAGLPAMTPSLGAAPHSATGRGIALQGAIAADEAFAKLSVDSNPAVAFGRFAAPDGVVLGARPVPPHGPDEIRSRFTAFPPDQQLAWVPRRDLGVAAAGLAATVGEAESGPRKGGTRDGYSKYVTIWREEPDGSWKYIFDLGSDRPSPGR